jgi:uncharacterized protein YkwD
MRWAVGKITNRGQNILLGLLPAFFSLSVSAAQIKLAKNSVVERSLPITLTSVLCERPIQSADLVSNGLYDAQVSAVILSPKYNGGKIPSAVIKEKALSLANSGQQLGYSYGLCDNGTAWAVTFPAPEAVSLEGSILNLPKVATSQCAKNSLKIIFSPEQRGRSFLVPIESGLTARLPSSKGYASVVCTPNKFIGSGPREWALIPLGGAKVNPSDLLPLQGLANKEALMDWINQKRRFENLPSFTVDGELTAAATGLALGKTIHHDMDALGKVRANLQKNGFELAGENRVEGKSLAEVAGLLWMSPGHRDLLLSPTAEHFGLSVASSETGVFMVMLVGRKIPGSVARK